MTKRKEFEVFETEANRSVCRSCHAPILWYRHRSTDGWMPLDVNSKRVDMLGNVFMESHHAHCPDAEKFRRKKR